MHLHPRPAGRRARRGPSSRTPRSLLWLLAMALLLAMAGPAQARVRDLDRGLRTGGNLTSACSPGSCPSPGPLAQQQPRHRPGLDLGAAHHRGRQAGHRAAGPRARVGDPARSPAGAQQRLLGEVLGGLAAARQHVGQADQARVLPLVEALAPPGQGRARQPPTPPLRSRAPPRPSVRPSWCPPYTRRTKHRFRLAAIRG